MDNTPLPNQGLPHMPNHSLPNPAASVEVTREGPVTVVSLCRAGLRNAVDPATALALYHAMLAFEADEAAAVAILTGTPECFCAGFDLEVVAAGAAGEWLAQLHFGEDGRPPLGPMGPTRLSLSKPVIAAIAGPAVAGGMELALWCDLRVMEATAWMGVLCRRWGVPLVDGGTLRLPRLVGVGRAMDLVLTGRRVDADECHAIGLCDRLVDPGMALAAARELALELSGLPQACLRSDRKALRKASGMDDLAALRAEFKSGLASLEEAARAGAARFKAGAGRHGQPAG